MDTHDKPAKARKRGPEGEWIDTVLKKGTIADRLAAHTLLVHESKDWKSLDALIAMVDTRKCRRRCLMAMSTLKELFLETLNLSNKKNKTATHSEEDKQKIRFYYLKFVDQLNSVAFDSLEETRKKAIWTLSELLTKYHENKEYILEKLINKMGDKVPKLAASAGHLIEKAVNHDKEDIRSRAIKYIQKFLQRSTSNPRARLYAISLLSRIKLIKGNHQVANDLIEIYLELYTTLTKEKNIDSRLMNTILVGIHRAYPYAKFQSDVFEQHLQTLYTLVHQVNFRMRVVAMVLIKNIVVKRSEITKCPVDDRFYNLIFGQLLQPDLLTSSRHDSFVNLLLNVINGDTVVERKEAFIKRMLQVSLNSPPDFARLLLTTITKIKGYDADLCMFNKDNDKMDEDDEEDDDENSDEADPGTGSEDEEDSMSGNVVVGSSWVHKKRKTSNHCDLLARNPRGAKPEHLNELYLLMQSYDPSIAGVAKQLIRA